jgi:hypothetical protein
MECLNAQCKEYFKWIWKCFHTKFLWCINFLGRGKRWNCFQSMFFGRGLFSFGWDCE